MEDNIKDAIKILKENGYIVKRFTEQMKKDSNECESSNCRKDCLDCSCSVCIIQ